MAQDKLRFQRYKQKKKKIARSLARFVLLQVVADEKVAHVFVAFVVVVKVVIVFGDRYCMSCFIKRTKRRRRTGIVRSESPSESQSKETVQR